MVDALLRDAVLAEGLRDVYTNISGHILGIYGWAPRVSGQVIGFRYHPRNIAPMSMDEETTTRMYRARRCLEEMTEDPRLRIQFVTEPGECTIFDNHRVLHARTGFQQATGVRHFRQCHVDREELHSRYRLLGERLDRPVPEEQLTRGLV